MEHSFTGNPYTVGVEEELMLLDAGTLELVSEVETMLSHVSHELPGEVKPELMESVLEVATDPCEDVDALDVQLRNLRREVRDVAGEHSLAIASAGTHPFALWEQQRIVARPRYRELIGALRFVARQLITFGAHVHVGVHGADRAIHVADGLREYIPLFYALSANSPLWRGHRTGMMSTRMPIFRQFPRVGIPPHYGDWASYTARVQAMIQCGAIEDYTYLWWDVRAHPNLGTVEVRAFDAQTRVEHTVGLTALVQSLVHKLSSDFDEGESSPEWPLELIDESKMLAALHGLEGEILNLRTGEKEPAKLIARRLLDELREHAEELGSDAYLDGIVDLLEKGTGARRQLVVYEANEDLVELCRDLVEVTGA